MWEAGFDQVPPEQAPPRLNIEGDDVIRLKHPDRHSLCVWELKARDKPVRIIVTANRVEDPITIAALDRPFRFIVEPFAVIFIELFVDLFVDLFVSFVLGIYSNLGTQNRNKLIQRI